MANFSVGQYITFKPEYDYGFGLPIFQVTGISGIDYTILVVESIPTWEAQGFVTGSTQTVHISDIDPYYMVTSYIPTPTTTGGFSIAAWLPMPPNEGPPFPRKFKIYWPWYKG